MDVHALISTWSVWLGRGDGHRWRCVALALAVCAVTLLFGAGVSCSWGGSRTKVRDIAVSSDGKTVYFVVGTMDRSSLCALALDSGKATVLSAFDTYAAEPVCTKDGTALLFVLAKGRDGSQIHRMDLTSGATKPVLSSAFFDMSPFIAPDGDTLAFVRSYGSQPRAVGEPFGHDLWIASLRSGRSRRLTQLSTDYGFGAGAFTPDGRTIYFSLDRGTASTSSVSEDIWTADIRTGRLNQVTHIGGYTKEPALSPDGKTVVFTSNKSRQAYEVWCMRPDGSELRQITHFGGRTFRMCSMPRFLPDGRTIVFILDDREVWQIGLDGSGARLLFRYE